MNKNILCMVVLGLLAAALGGCETTKSFIDASYANDTVRYQELSRQNRGIPDATEMPPGLGEDLPLKTADGDTQVGEPEPISTNNR